MQIIGLKVSASKSEVYILRGEGGLVCEVIVDGKEELVCEVIVDGRQLELLSEFKDLGFCSMNQVKMERNAVRKRQVR